jgi:hypothetical protein
MKLALTALALATVLCSCGAGAQTLSGDSVCVGFNDAGGAQATVTSGGITIVVPLMRLSRDAGDAGDPLAP